MKRAQIVEVPTLNGGIAKVNVATGVITVARDRFYQYPEQVRRFVILHEMGHLVTGSSNEFVADEWAARQFIKEGGSPKMAVFALSRILPFNNPEHYERLKRQLDRVRHLDFHYNGNFKALKSPPHPNTHGIIRSYPQTTI